MADESAPTKAAEAPEKAAVEETAKVAEAIEAVAAEDKSQALEANPATPAQQPVRRAMTKKTVKAVAALALGSALALAPSVQAATVFALAADGSTLLRFDSSAPAASHPSASMSNAPRDATWNSRSRSWAGSVVVRAVRGSSFVRAR